MQGFLQWCLARGQQRSLSFGFSHFFLLILIDISPFLVDTMLLPLLSLLWACEMKTVNTMDNVYSFIVGQDMGKEIAKLKTKWRCIMYITMKSVRIRRTLQFHCLKSEYAAILWTLGFAMINVFTLLTSRELICRFSWGNIGVSDHHIPKDFPYISKTFSAEGMVNGKFF